MKRPYYIGLDIHKIIIVFYIKLADGTDGTIDDHSLGLGR